MARARTLLALRTEVRALTDTVADEHVSDDQVNIWINQGIAELWRKLAKTRPDQYAIEGSNISTTAGTSSYTVAAAIMSLLRVVRLDGTRRIPLDEWSFAQAPYDNADSRANALSKYRLVGGGIDGTGARIVFDPDPGTRTYAYWYIQAPQTLASDIATFDGIAGYEDWVVLYTALRVFIRQQDPEQIGIVAEMKRIELDIATPPQRNVGRAPTIADVRPRRRRI